MGRDKNGQHFRRTKKLKRTANDVDDEVPIPAPGYAAYIARIQELYQKLRNANAEISKLKSEKAELQDEQEVLIREIVGLQGELTKANRKYAKARGMLYTCGGQVSKLVDKLYIAAKDYRDLKKKMDGLEMRYTECVTESDTEEDHVACNKQA